MNTGAPGMSSKARQGVEPFLSDLREELRAGTFRPLAVKERAISKRGGKLRYLGDPDRSAIASFRPPSNGAGADL